MGTAPVVLGARGSRGVHIGSGAVARGSYRRGRRCFRVLPVRSGAFQYTRADGSVHKFQSS